MPGFWENVYKTAMKNPTLTEDERQAFWNRIVGLSYDLESLKGMVQKPMRLTNADLARWADTAASLRQSLKKLQQDVLMTASSKI
jgi:hypothetical protein